MNKETIKNFVVGLIGISVAFGGIVLLTWFTSALINYFDIGGEIIIYGMVFFFLVTIIPDIGKGIIKKVGPQSF